MTKVLSFARTEEYLSVRPEADIVLLSSASAILSLFFAYSPVLENLCIIQMCIRDRFYGASNMKVMNYGLKKEFLDRYDVDAVLKENHLDRKSTRLNSSHLKLSRMPSSA